jgi:transcriptional regulator with XRE-family HTH domain
MLHSDLKAWRTKEDFTQSRAAQQLECSRMTYSRWESGATKIPALVAKYVGLRLAVMEMQQLTQTKLAFFLSKH